MYFFLGHKETEEQKKALPYLTVLLFGVSIVLCMVFPLKLDNGFNFDLRTVCLIIVFLYCGWKERLAVFAKLIGFRWYLGGIGIPTALIVTSLVALGAILLAPVFRKTRSSNWTVRNRLLAAIYRLRNRRQNMSRKWTSRSRWRKLQPLRSKTRELA
ncbi:LytS/YhcK type 5TM receptor domain-containing protein [Effusibacillus dendaii]|uniref:LytS/YhcK type 5TM receptor domain-containing protein n=1 Tax=Effusibacillus dendaii TaxID=2743772 RepID=UPI00190931F5